MEAHAGIKNARPGPGAKGLQEGGPSLAILEGAIPWSFLFGIFSQGSGDEPGKPELNGTTDKRWKFRLLGGSGNGIP